jgi:isopentenyl phosphate kinase
MMIIKFGGSVITHKAKKGTFNSEITRKLIIELRDYYDELINEKKIEGKKKGSKLKRTMKSNSKKVGGDIDYNLMLVHGAGSFGHIQAKKYHLDNGYKNKEQLMGLSEVHNDVRDLNLRFMNELLSFGFPGISIPPMVILRNQAKNISYMDSDIFKRVLDIHSIPVTFGDVVPDDSLGFSICSGDSIIQKLAEFYQPSKVIFITDVDGLATNNPNIDPNAQLIDELTQDSFSNAFTTENINPDVTGGIHSKSKIALALAGSGVETYIINGTIQGRFGAALRGEPVTGTVAKVQK